MKVTTLPPSKVYAFPGTCNISLIKIRTTSLTLILDPLADKILVSSAFEEDAKKITDFQNKHKQWVHNGGVVKFLTEGKI